MDKFIDLKIRKFQQFIVDYINSFEELPIEIKRLAVAEILNQIERESDRIIGLEQNQLKQQSEVKQDAEGVQPELLGEQAE